MTQINIRIDDELKKDAEEVCSDIGLSMSAAINVFLKRLVKERKIPFELSADPKPEPVVADNSMRELRKSIEQIESVKAYQDQNLPDNIL